MIQSNDINNFLKENILSNKLGEMSFKLNLNSVLSSIAKTDYKTILEHNKDIIKYIENNIIPFKYYSVLKYCNYFNITIKDFFIDLIFVVLMHDYGKTNIKWQNFIQKIIKGEKIKSSHVRHEFVSFIQIVNLYKRIKKYDSYKDIYYIFFPIFAHHGNLSKDFILNYDFQNDFPQTPSKNDILKAEDFFNELNDIIEEKKKKENINSFDLWYRQEIFRYLLANGDKKASANKINIPCNCQLEFNDKFKDNYRPFQQEILNNAEENILLVRAKTGGGKTFGAIRWGVEQIIKGKAERIIFAMPTQFTSNSITNDISEFIKDTTTYHSGVKNSINTNFDRYFYLKHCQNLESNVNVVTIDQLLYALTLTNEEYKVSCFNLINSCLIIDEVDFYDSFTMMNVIKLITFCSLHKVKLLIMSATLPSKFVNIIEEQIGNRIKLIDFSYNDKKERIRIINNTFWHEEIYDEILNLNDCIIYCNTVYSAISLYEILKQKREDVVVYHSRMLIDDKLIQEEKIIKMLGKESWNNKTNKGIVIMTQIGELSINISSDYIYTEIAPMDRLVQRFGRGCRFNDNNICKVTIILPTDSKGKAFYMPYVTKDRNVFIPNNIIRKTIDNIEMKSYSYNDYMEIINEIYSDFEIDDLSRTNAEKLDYIFNENVIFNNSSNYEDMDDGRVNQADWKTRNVEPNINIYINDKIFMGENLFDDINSLIFAKEKYKLSIKTYEAKLIEKIIINKEYIVEGKIISLKILPEQYYHNKKDNIKGLNIKELIDYCRSSAEFI